MITRRYFSLQQDGATAHITVRAGEWREGKFGDRMISRFSCRPLPPCTPEMSSLNYRLWSVCPAELRMSPSATLERLNTTVDEYRTP